MMTSLDWVASRLTKGMAAIPQAPPPIKANQSRVGIPLRQRKLQQETKQSKFLCQVSQSDALMPIGGTGGDSADLSV